jgi:hypothetical protein
MGDWVRRFMAMPDRQRAKLLAQLLLIFTVAVLYGLGGVSLYLRARYLNSTPTPGPMATRDAAMAPTIEPTLNRVDTPIADPMSKSGSETRIPASRAPALGPTPTLPTISPTETLVAPSPTLYPTLTPRASTSALGPALSTSGISLAQGSPGQAPGTFRWPGIF